ncbi:PDDEXK family nuclease [Hymenobacter actinosclerus]|nr:hypothetical protein [Hymenobacter actinosclerus]
MPPDPPAPILASPPAQEYVDKPDSLSFNILIIFSILFIAAIYMSFIYFEFVYTLPILLIFAFLMIPSSWEDGIKYISLKREYKINLALSIEKHKRELSTYKHFTMVIHNELVAKYPDIVQKSKSLESVKIHREQLYKKFFNESRPPLIHPSYESIKKGYYENNVYGILIERFNDLTLVNYSAQSEENEVHLYAPLPDFVIHDSHYNYSIVIEIDEPYELNMGYPIHCIGYDDDRDKYFLERNWFIIRFSESQFVNYPQECCDVIKHFIDYITANSEAQEIYQPNYSNIQEKAWSYEDAIHMESVDYRETYLPELNLYRNHPFPRLAPKSASRRKHKRVNLENLKNSKNYSSGLKNDYKSSIDIDNIQNDLPF